MTDLRSLLRQLIL